MSREDNEHLKHGRSLTSWVHSFLSFWPVGNFVSEHYLCEGMHLRILACMPLYACACVCYWIHTHIHVHVLNKHIQSHICTYTYTQAHAWVRLRNSLAAERLWLRFRQPEFLYRILLFHSFNGLLTSTRGRLIYIYIYTYIYVHGTFTNVYVYIYNDSDFNLIFTHTHTHTHKECIHKECIHKHDFNSD